MHLIARIYTTEINRYCCPAQNPAVSFLSDTELLETHYLESPFHDPLTTYNNTLNLGALEEEYCYIPHKFSTFGPIELAKEGMTKRKYFSLIQELQTSALVRNLSYKEYQKNNSF
jgi:hypothetical protein